MGREPGLGGEEIAVADIGGTHARFAVAQVARGRVMALGEAFRFRVADHASLPQAWRAFAAALGRAPPRAAAFAVACPIRGDELKFTNNPWRLRPAELGAELGLDSTLFINDFGAVGHAVAQSDPADLVHVAGPLRPPPKPGVVSVLGPGTGLGVAQLLFDASGYQVVETEGAHIDFAPRDAFEDALLARLRRQFGRVSVERIVSGPGLAQIRAALPGADAAPGAADDKSLWEQAISGADPLARMALERFCALLGAFAGDAVLIHGGQAVVLAGGLAPRIVDFLRQPGFARAFAAKGRYAEMLADTPVWMIAHPQPGLFGAAAAFAARHR